MWLETRLDLPSELYLARPSSPGPVGQNVEPLWPSPSQPWLCSPGAWGSTSSCTVSLSLGEGSAHSGPCPVALSSSSPPLGSLLWREPAAP